MADQSNEAGFHLSSTPDETEITQPAAENARRSVQLPLRLLLVSDLAPQARSPDWSDGTLRIHRVDKYSFPELIERVAPQLTVEVPNRISETPKQLEVDLRFSHLDAFRPEEIVRQVPPLNQLFEVRTLVVQVRDRDIDLVTFQERVQEKGIERDWAEQLYQTLTASEQSKSSFRQTDSSSRQKTSEDDPVDRILGMVTTDDGTEDKRPEETAAESEVSDIMDALVGAVAGDSAPEHTVEVAAAEQLISQLDTVLSDQLNALMSHAEFRRLEAAWRGLKFLIDRINFRENIQLEVLSAGKYEIEQALHYQVLMPEHRDETERPPLSAVIINLAFSPGHRDLRLLKDLAETGASLQVPIIASADPSFFAAETPGELARMPVLKQLFERDIYAEWNGLRNRDEAKFLTLALPPFLLRYPYGSEQPTEGFVFEESGYLWGQASLAVAVVAANSFARTGWPTHLAGHPVEDLPVRTTNAGVMPVSALFPEETQAELAEAGFTVLGSQLNRDFVYAEHAQTIHRPKTYEEPDAAAEARVHASLPCQLFVSRAAQYLLRIQQQLQPGQDIDQVQTEVEARLLSFLSPDGKPLPDGTISIEPIEEADRADQKLLAVRLRPPRSALDRQVSLVMGLQIPGGQ